MSSDNNTTDKARPITYIGTSEIVDQHLAPRVIKWENNIREVSLTLEIDSDKEIYLDLEKDLYFDRSVCFIKEVKNYSNTNSPFIHLFKPGVSLLKFQVVGAVDKFPEILRPKIMGLGIKLTVDSKGQA